MSARTARPTVLVVDDEKNIRRSIEIALEHEGFNLVCAHDLAAALRTLHERIVDCLILDIRLGEIDGIALYRKLQSEGRAVPTIFISGHATLTEAAQAVKIGGFDFIEKPFSAEKIAVAVRRCLEYSALKDRLSLIESMTRLPEIVGDSAAMRRVIVEALKVAASNANVLITGESGTGKELIANTIHGNSDRKHAPFVKVNCSAIPESLVESELFGYERGAFSGAAVTKRGLFEMAHRGVIFLDEVADLSLSAQAKILRALQSGEIQKLGSEKSVIVDARVVSATHKDLKRCVAEGAFREDLYYRLNVVPIKVPSLRERAEDIPLLANVIVKRLCEKNNLKEKTLDEDALWELRHHSWPGNVRELQNVLERVLIMSGDRISALDLPEEIGVSPERSAPGAGCALREFRDRAERDFIIATLKRNNGNISQSAIDLGVRRPYLHRRLALLKVSKRDFLI